MDVNLQHPAPASKPGKKPRFVFNIARDIELLKAALLANPWQMGKSMWDDICKGLMQTYGYNNLVPRTCKERVDLLVAKLKKEELESKTGTEEEVTERQQLLQDIITLQEQARNDTIVRNIGSEVGTEDSEMPQSQLSRRQEKLAADEDRENLLSQTSISDHPPTPDGVRKKRTIAATEADIVFKRCKHDMEMEMARQKFVEETKEKDLALGNRKIDLEMMRERRYAEEGRRREEEDNRRAEENMRRDEMMGMMLGVLQSIQNKRVE